jgi:hypothetical protein
LPGGAHGASPLDLQITRSLTTETFKISPDPLLTGKIRDVIGLYLAPPANAAGARWMRRARSRLIRGTIRASVTAGK